ncbi:MAG: imelysin family protein [Myxococcota bacterium]
MADAYADTVSGAQDLDAAVVAFLAAPSAPGHRGRARRRRASREPYLHTEAFRFYEGPIDDPVTGPEGMINAWPLDEQYIDYTVDDPDAGIVNDPSVAIDADTLASLNEQGGEEHRHRLPRRRVPALGPGPVRHRPRRAPPHRLPDRRHRHRRAPGPARRVPRRRQRPARDAADGDAQDAWALTCAAFEPIRGRFARSSPASSCLSGFETGGERLQAAIDSGDREDEHSCFSDNTHRDMIGDVQGILDAWQTIRGVVAEVDADLAGQLDAKIAASLALAEALQPPFEQEIAPGSEGNARVQALIVSLHEQEQLLFQVFDRFGLTVEIPE